MAVGPDGELRSPMQRLVDAVVAIGGEPDLTSTLQRITEAAAGLADARYAALGVLDVSGQRLEEFVTVGVDDDLRAEIGHLPEGHGLLGVLIAEATPLRLRDLHEHPASYGFPPGHPPMRSFLGVPVLIRGEVFGNLYLTEKQGAPEFTALDEELVGGLAVAAGVAIENTRLHAHAARVLLLEDRERIARDLHDTVIQRVFATGLSLQGTLPLIHADPDSARARIEAAVDDLDETVRQVRAAIFSLEAAHRVDVDLRSEVLRVCEEAVAALGFDPQVAVEAPLDVRLGGELVADLLATLREALSNVGRHAQATTAEVVVAVDDHAISLSVTDDGIGPPEGATGTGHGLANMAERAARHGGRAELVPGPPKGARLQWTVPRS